MGMSYGNLGALGEDTGIDWGEIFSTAIKTAPTIISSIKGQSYGTSQFGPSGGGPQAYGGGLQTAGGIPGLGGGSLDLSSNTLLLLGIAVVALLVLRK
jgi:hypothetical protein